MSTSEAADQVVRMTLNGVEVAARISGAGAKQLAVVLYAILSEQKKTKGRTRLESMLKSGKELKVFSVKEEDLRKFTQEAKRYGVLYCALRKGKGSPDDLCDIMVRAEDASKINRIIERFHLIGTDTATVKSEILRDREAKAKQGVSPVQKDELDKLIDELLPKRPEIKNPTPAAKESNLSGNSSATDRSDTKPSVRQQLQEYRAAMQKQEEHPKVKQHTPQHKQPAKKIKRTKER